jgi:hypothetical protein
MVMCQQCKGEMTDGISCLSDPISMGGGLFEPIRWGSERQTTRWVIDFPCRDCSTPIGGVHHPGCCIERCPVCLGQALGCPCFGEPDDDDDDNEDGDSGDDDGDLAAHLRRRTRCRAHLFLRHYRR